MNEIKQVEGKDSLNTQIKYDKIRKNLYTVVIW
jgi:hypothetical protein